MDSRAKLLGHPIRVERITSALGMAGTAFHAWGVHRRSSQSSGHDVPNLWICDGSLLPARGGANPSLTIMALACRIGDRITEMARRGEIQ
jgi:choline dehydrogenase-like flavoprotein